jgi:hypothetical protein
MNARTVRKLLMRNRSRVFWGRRAYLSVRLPAPLVPPAPPPLEFPGFAPSDVMGGMWLSPGWWPDPARLAKWLELEATGVTCGSLRRVRRRRRARLLLHLRIPAREGAPWALRNLRRRRGAGLRLRPRSRLQAGQLPRAHGALLTPNPARIPQIRPLPSPDETEWISIGRWSCGAEPRQEAPWEPVYFPACERCGETYESWSFWTGHRGRTVDGLTTREPLPESVVARHKARSDWFDALRDGGQHPVLDAFLRAGDWARSVSWSLDGDHLVATFAVKWFYPETKRRFCAALGRAMKTARDGGARARVLRS